MTLRNSFCNLYRLKFVVECIYKLCKHRIKGELELERIKHMTLRSGM